MKILAVDDEEKCARNMERILMDTLPDANVNCYINPVLALECAGKTKADIAFLDVEMPEMDGITLAKHLKKINPEINIIIVKAYERYCNDAFDIFASGYIMKPITPEAVLKQIDNLRYPVREYIKSEKNNVAAITFGEFELFVNGKPVHFPRKKSKELFAYLIDRNGVPATKRQISDILFPGREYDRSCQDYIAKVIKGMEDALKEAGAKQILKKGWNSYSLNTENILCDLYEWKRGAPWALNSFHNEYMTGYKWAKNTLENMYSN